MAKTILPALALLAIGAIEAPAQTMPDIGPTIIPFYTGNLSVDSFMRYMGTRKEPPTPQVTPESIAQLKRISCFAVCDYASWPLAEQEPGKWDFSLYQGNADKLRAAGIQYNIFCWVHFPPKWFLGDPSFVPYRCLEHGEPVLQTSLWAPATRKAYERFYEALAKAMGSRIAFLRLAMPSEYGEIGYPVGMTNWIAPQKHVHQGFWCGDPEARKSFRAYAMKRYRGLAALNAAWGTSFATADAIEMPSVTPAATAQRLEPAQAAARVRWLDFIDWYNESWADFLIWSAGVVKRDFPGFGLPQAGRDLRTRHEIIASLGYGQEAAAIGNDQSRYVAAMRRAGLSVQTPGAIGYFATRRVSSACALYGVPYYTEPPADVNRDGEVQRIWMDASNGSQVFFDYPQNLDAARDLFAKYKEHLNGKRSVADVGLFLCKTTQALHPDQPWPPRIYTFAETVRGALDYEVLDERMIEDDGLRKLGIRTLVLADADYVEPAAMRALTAWVKAGGVLVSLQSEPVRTIDGSDALWKSLAPATVAPDTQPPDPARIWREGGRRVGKGYVVVLPGGPGWTPLHVGIAMAVHTNLAALLPGASNGRGVCAGPAGLLTSLFADRILYYNPGDQPVSADVSLRPQDFGGAIGRPASYRLHLDVPPHSIHAVPLTQ